MSQCPVCFETFSRQEGCLPRTLLCGHSVCHSCLHKIQTPSLRVPCPICRTPSSTPRSGFPVNYALLESLEAKIAANAPSPAVIGPCADCGERLAALHCQTCGDLCADCSLAIHKRRVAASHVLCDIKDKAAPSSMCAQHKAEAVKLYCMKCEALVCLLCTFGSHRGHPCEELNQAFEAQASLVRERARFVKSHIQQISGRLNQIASEQKQVDAERKQLTEASASRYSARLRELQRREQAMRAALESHVTSKRQRLEAMGQEWVRDLEALGRLDKEVEAFTKAGAVSGLASCDALLKTLESKMGELKEPAAGINEAAVDVGAIVSRMDAWVASILAWSVPFEHALFSVECDDRGLERTVHRVTAGKWASVRSVCPLLPCLALAEAVISGHLERVERVGFRVRLTRTAQSNIYIGVCGAEFFQSNSIALDQVVGDSKHSWGISACSGRKGHNGEFVGYTEACRTGDVIGVEVSPRNRTISFSKNGVSLDVAFQNVALPAQLFAVVSLYNVGDQVTLLED